MRCDNCDRQMDYTFYIDNKFWRKVVGEENFKKHIGRWCPHCVLQKLGGLHWYLIFNEPSERVEESRQTARTGEKYVDYCPRGENPQKCELCTERRIEMESEEI